jgi:PPM family protein phosphatase
MNYIADRYCNRFFMISAHASHAGLVRKNNEDCVRADDALGIYLLADGIGGLDAGEVASALAVDTVYDVLRINIPHTAVDGYFELMEHAMRAAHWEINTREPLSLKCKRMGTTLVVAVVRDNKAYIVHAGDSRCYLYQKLQQPITSVPGENGVGNLKRLTHDHTVGDQQMASGISIGQIPKKHFHTLTQAVGCGDPPSPDFKIVDLTQNDLLLICSDGLTDMLTDAMIAAILANEQATMDTLAADLVNAANKQGGRDNISVILIKLP